MSRRLSASFDAVPKSAISGHTAGINMGRLLRATAAALALALAGLMPTHAQQPGSSVAPTEYRLGSGDVVRITVFQNPELTLETRINETGVISYPLLGSVRLGGQSVTAAEKSIADGLRNGNFVKSPQVTLVLLQVRGNQANVLGQVNRPGRYPIEIADMRLTDMLAMAGGAAPNGADTVVVTGERNGKPFRAEVDLPSVFAAGGRDKDLFILNGDAIWIDRQPVVYIYGEVQRPGPMRLEREMTLMQALATGGGLNARGTEKGIRVHRKTAAGATEVQQLKMDDKLRDGDVVFVRESLF